MKATAKLRYLRIAPRKVRMAADLIRGKGVEEAKRLLTFAAKHSAHPVLKTLNSAVASAKDNFQAEESNLYVSHITVNEGPKLKRYRARARGQAYEIQKKTSHVTLIVNEVEEQKAKPKAKKASTKPEAKVEQKPAEKPEVKEETQKSAAPRPSFRPQQESQKPKEQRGLRRFFRRKAV